MWVVDGGAVTEVPDSLAGVLRSSEQHAVGALWGAESELVEGQALTAGLEDARTSTLREAQSAHGELWHLVEAVVVSDGANKNSDLVLLALHVAGQAGQRQRRLVGLALV